MCVIISLWHFVCFTVAALSLKWLKWFFRSGAPLTEGPFCIGGTELEHFWQNFLGFWPLWMGHSKLWRFQATIQSALLQWWQSAVNQYLFQPISCLQFGRVRWMVRESLVNVKMYKKTNEYENCKNKTPCSNILLLPIK